MHADRASLQLSRHVDLSSQEGDLLKGGKHVLVAYDMGPRAGYGYLAVAAIAAVASAGINGKIGSADNATDAVDALVYYIWPPTKR